MFVRPRTKLASEIKPLVVAMIKARSLEQGSSFSASSRQMPLTTGASTRIITAAAESINGRRS